MPLGFFARISLLNWIVVGLIVVCLVPIWAFRYIPTSDGPSHLNNAQILSQYTNPAYNFHKTYNLRLSPFPNWLSHASLAGLMWLVPPLGAEKILLSLYVIGFPLGFMYFLSAVDPAKKPLGLLSFAFVYSYLFMMGFYNFVFSIPLAFLALGYFWKHRFHLTRGNIFVLNLLLLLVYFAHLISYMVVLGSIALLAVVHFRYEALPDPTGSPGRKKETLARSFLCLLPTLLLLIDYYLGSPFAWNAPAVGITRSPNLLLNFLSMSVLNSDFSGQRVLGLAMAILIGLLITLTLTRRVASFRTSPQRLFRFEDCILGLFLGLFVLYLIVPFGYGGGGWINDRFALLGSLFLLAWTDLPRPMSNVPAAASSANFRIRLKRLFPAALTVLGGLLSLAFIVSVIYSFSRIEPVLQEYTGGSELIRPNSVLLALNFTGSNPTFGRINPLIHASHYDTLTNGAINLGNYEPLSEFFPLVFKPGLHLPFYRRDWQRMLNVQQHTLDLCGYVTMVDYLLVWDTPDSFYKADIDRCYRLIFARGRQKIFVPHS